MNYRGSRSRPQRGGWNAWWLAPVFCSSCATWEAIQQLPEGYGLATWGLVEAMFSDLFSILTMFL